MRLRKRRGKVQTIRIGRNSLEGLPKTKAGAGQMY
jgi:hypothetical protein